MRTETATRPARVFQNGNSLAVRLPKGWARAGMRLRASRNARGILLAAERPLPKTLGALQTQLRRLAPEPAPLIRAQPVQVRSEFEE